MEKTVKLQTSDNHTIYGTLNGSATKNSKLIIFVHGLSGNQYEHQYFNAAPFFTKNGYDTFRFDLYSREKGARQLSECSLAIHAQDLNTVVKYFKKSYDKIFLVGHSFGVPVIFCSDLTDISKLILWDPTDGMKSLEEKNCVYNEKHDKYVLQWGLEILISQEMVDDWKSVSILKELIAKIAKPSKFIFAEKSDKYVAWRPFLPFIKAPHESVVIDDATHMFIEEGVEQLLFEETLKWLEAK